MQDNKAVLPINKKRQLRKLKAGWRDTWLLLGEFAVPLLIFLITLFVGGVSYYLLSAYAGEPLGNLLESVYQVLSMTFLQPSGSFSTYMVFGNFLFHHACDWADHPCPGGHGV